MQWPALCWLHTVFYFRLISFIILFTPSLGLFDCLHHGRLAALHAKDGHHMKFYFSPDGLHMNFSDVWEPLTMKDISYFPDMPVIAVCLILMSMIVFHIFASTLFRKLCLKTQFSADYFLQGLHSFISPPLHFDWELLYGQNTENISVFHCWKRW